jgi:flavin reductase (DIM6/NTAB) family NADH-FMN oxidoreductase RutF
VTAENLTLTRFRDAMAQLPTPVSVITALTGTRPHGTTVSAITSLSLDPPMVLVSLDRGSDLLRIVRVTSAFGVNILSSTQPDLAIRFAAKGADKFDGLSWHVDDGVPRLPDTSGWLRCEVAGLVDGGDHVIVLGSVTTAEVFPATPLTYHARTFGTHTAFESSSDQA